MIIQFHPFPYRPEVNQREGRSLPTLPDVKRSLKKIFFAWTFYGPEVGLCSCLFKYAWFNYPIVPEMSHAVMSRASRMVNGLMSDFMEGYRNANRNPPQHSSPQYANPEYSSPDFRISNKVAAMTEDDYYDYRTQQVLQNLGPFRRVGGAADDSSEKAPAIGKLDPKVANVVEMLKHLQPKGNASEFVTRLARHLRSPPQMLNNVQPLRVASDGGRRVRYFIKNRHNDDGVRSIGNVTKPTIRRTNYGNGDDGRAYGLVPPPLGPSFKTDRLGFDGAESLGPPPGLPSFSQLPPADYTYFEDGVYHHVHDLRQDKGSHGQDEGFFDLEEVILQALGLTQARSAPTILKCGKHYVFSAILRFFQTALLG